MRWAGFLMIFIRNYFRFCSSPPYNLQSVSQGCRTKQHYHSFYSHSRWKCTSVSTFNIINERFEICYHTTFRDVFYIGYHDIIKYARNIQEIYWLIKIDLNIGGQSWKLWRRWPRNTASYANSAQWFGYFLESFHKIVVVLSHKTLYIIPLRHKTSLGLAPWLLYFSRKMSFVFYSQHER